MSAPISRRGFLGIASLVPLGFSLQASQEAAAVHARYPAQEDDQVRDVVGASHGNLPRVRELVTARPALARSSWDWGWGDWETAIDAASHVGNRPIVEFLLANGARPTIFTFVMLGHLSIVRASIEATPGLQRTRGPHGLTMMVHARAGGPPAAEMVKYLESLGDADPQYPDRPVSDAEQAAMLGEYAFGSAPTERFKVVKGPRWFTIERPGHSARNLFHHGGLVFNPAGAEAVRIHFESATLTATDGPISVKASRL